MSIVAGFVDDSFDFVQAQTMLGSQVLQILKFRFETYLPSIEITAFHPDRAKFRFNYLCRSFGLRRCRTQRLGAAILERRAWPI